MIRTSCSGASWLPTGQCRDGFPALVCFPYAGGGVATFRDWDGKLSTLVDVRPVQLPGRGSRLAERAYGSLPDLIDDMAPALSACLPSNYVLFGHSMGALIAYEFALWLRSRGRPDPAALVVSAFRAPHVPDVEEPVHAADDDAFVEHLLALKGTPTEVLQHQELRELIMPTLRADFQMCETYRWQSSDPLGCPILAYCGSCDDRTPAADVGAWRSYTRDRFTLRVINGDHLFINTEREALIDDLASYIHELLTD